MFALQIKENIRVKVVPMPFVAAQKLKPRIAGNGINKPVHVRNFILPAQGIRKRTQNFLRQVLGTQGISRFGVRKTKNLFRVLRYKFIIKFYFVHRPLL
jgi:hypothetical protein